VLRAACGARCSANLATVVRRRHNGPQLLDALTLISIVDPTFRNSFDVPNVLRRARLGDLSGLRLLLRTTSVWQAAPAEALSQGLHASALCADWRFPWGDSGTAVSGRTTRLARAAARLRSRGVAVRSWTATRRRSRAMPSVTATPPRRRPRWPRLFRHCS
jgi:hypothetical protein